MVFVLMMGGSFFMVRVSGSRSRLFVLSCYFV